MLYSRPPPLEHLCVFGSLCYVHNQKHGGNKFAPRGTRFVFIGYPFGQKGWLVYDLDMGRISTSRDVIFRENEFPYVKTINAETSSVQSSLKQQPIFVDDDYPLHDGTIAPSSTIEFSHDPTSPAITPSPLVPLSEPNDSDDCFAHLDHLLLHKLSKMIQPRLLQCHCRLLQWLQIYFPIHHL